MTYRYIEPTFTFAGVSTLKGKIKVRYANDINRAEKTLPYHGHTEISLLPLPWPMTKLEATEYLIEIDFAEGNSVIADVLTTEKAKRTV